MQHGSARDHEDIGALADRIAGMAGAADSFSPSEIAKARLDLCKRVKLHNAEDLEGLAAVGSEVRRRHAELFRRFEEGVSDWHHASIAFNCDWPLTRVAEDPAGFLAAFRQLTVRLRARMHWEDAYFYPTVLGAAGGGAVAGNA